MDIQVGNGWFIGFGALVPPCFRPPESLETPLLATYLCSMTGPAAASNVHNSVITEVPPRLQTFKLPCHSGTTSCSLIHWKKGRGLLIWNSTGSDEGKKNENSGYHTFHFLTWTNCDAAEKCAGSISTSHFGNFFLNVILPLFFFFFASIKCGFHKCVPQLVSAKTPSKLAATVLAGAAISAFFLVVVVSLSGRVSK